MIGTFPIGGVVWDYGQYALGLERLGFEVYYLEDAGWLSYDPDQRDWVEDAVYGVKYLKQSLSYLSKSLSERWHFRSANGKAHGMSASHIAEVVKSAKLMINVSGGTLLRDEYLTCPRKVLIDTDPGWNHFHNYPRMDANPTWGDRHGYRAHDYFFTYAERMGCSDCLLPDLGLNWQPTRPPVIAGRWRQKPPGKTWTTVMTWKSFTEQIEYRGVKYGTKDIEFEKIKALPGQVPFALELAIGGDPPRQELHNLGWSVVDAHPVSVTPRAYRNYIISSRGEFSVAKNAYVATRSGWFSGRSACYLAAARPVVVQDTGFSEVLPCGEGLLAFNSLEQAAECLRHVEDDYPRHQRAARRIAREYFDSDLVLGELLQRIGLG